MKLHRGSNRSGRPPCSESVSCCQHILCTLVDVCECDVLTCTSRPNVLHFDLAAGGVDGSGWVGWAAKDGDTSDVLPINLTRAPWLQTPPDAGQTDAGKADAARDAAADAMAPTDAGMTDAQPTDGG